MKISIKYVLQTLLVNDFVYILLSPFIYIADRLKASRFDYKNATTNEKMQLVAERIFADQIVLNGPFKGLQFSTNASTSSSTYAKLLGSYETEIHPFIHTVLQNKYDRVINIGCDDGYYALGFAKLMPLSSVIAYDINEKAIENATKLAQKNGLQHQITFSGGIFSQDIEQIDPKLKTLFIVDCEGAEKLIFTKQNVHKLINADLIIELHINLYPELEDYFRDIFKATHSIKIVNSIDNHLKAKEYSFPQIDGLNYEERHFITQEREVFMQWMMLTANKD